LWTATSALPEHLRKARDLDEARAVAETLNPVRKAAQDEEDEADRILRQCMALSAATKPWDPVKHPRGQHGWWARKSYPSKAPVRIIGRGVQKAWNEVVGHELAPEAAASLVGAPADADVEVSVAEGKFGPAIQIDVFSKKCIAQRFLERDLEGRLFIRNRSFFVADSEQGHGLGSQIFAAQIQFANKVGVAYIQADAARGERFNGYYTWPRLGYDLPLENVTYDVRVEAQKRFPDAKTVLDIMRTREGRRWWKLHGDSLFGAKFDLSDGSRSLRVLHTYLRHRARHMEKAS
jgi:GNAT superfamily N-acetyltransferase